METQNLNKLRAILDELAHNEIEQLSPAQRELVSEAQIVLNKADKEANKKKLDWTAMVDLGVQATKLIIELMMSGGS
jgi:hypothetical protein